jgi:toxin ParE1/3/4
MAMFRLTQLALADLRSIGRYTQINWGRGQRNRYLAKLDECFHLLAEKPLRGVSCDDLRSGYRKYPVGRHIVFYREAQAGIEIIRILHVSIDVESNLDDR